MSDDAIWQLLGHMLCSNLHANCALHCCPGRVEAFTAAAVLYAAANACLGATPSAYAADVMPSSISGLGLGIYRCAGDLGKALPC